MARLIIGHITDSSVKIWVRGENSHPWANLTIFEGVNTLKTIQLELEERHGYTGCIEVKNLNANIRYTCQVLFGKDKNSKQHLMIDFGHCRGHFITAAAPTTEIGIQPFSFLLGSCNLHSLGLLQSPDNAYETLINRSVQSDVKFMIHCGDQIYYDIPNFIKTPDINEYRQKYLDAWQDCRPARLFLTQLPHYMILDDHEIFDNFSNDMHVTGWAATPQQFKDIAMKAYREFVHIRHPTFDNQSYHYKFNYGQVHFFVLDTRTERWSNRSNGANQIIGQEQLLRLKTWLKENKNAIKFIVSSVPFVAEVRHSDDKWNADIFKHQREEIIEFIVENKIKNITFLTGDMHNSYYAKMTIKAEEQISTIHELMSSPINQIGKSSIDQYDLTGVAKTSSNGVVYQSSIEKSSFYNDHSNAMLIKVHPDQIEWEIFRAQNNKTDKKGSFTL